MQLSSKQAPEFGGAKGDVGSTIVSILEVALDQLRERFEFGERRSGFTNWGVEQTLMVVHMRVEHWLRKVKFFVG